MSATTMAEVLVDHQRQNASSCLCGWAKLGHSHPEHQEAMLTAAGFGSVADAKAEAPPIVRHVDLTTGETGVLDEVVASNATVHLEAMADNHWWMIITSGGQSVHVNLHTKRAKITGTAEVE